MSKDVQWLWLLVLLVEPVIADENPADTLSICDSLKDSPEAELVCRGFNSFNDSDLPADALATIRSNLESPETLNKVLSTFLERDHGWQFLNDIDFKIKAFDSKQNERTSLGFSYDYAKSFTRRELRCSDPSCIRGMDFSFSATGNVAFESDLNPRDFLDTRLSFSVFQSKGGVQPGSKETQDRINDLTDRFFAAESDSEADEIGEQAIAVIRTTLTPQLYFSLAGDFALESDQKFDQKQYVWSIRGAIDFKDWTNKTAWSTYNIFDVPAAFIRAASGFDGCGGGGGGTCFKPRGTAWPTLLLGAGRVSPQAEDPRAMVGDTSDFTRVDAEISYRSPIARFGGDSIYFSANWRYFKELDAIDAVKTANLDEFTLLTLVIGGTEGVYVSYSDGKLPFSIQDDQVFELGLQFKL